MHNPNLPMSHVSVMMSLQTLLSTERAEGIDARFGFRLGETGYVATLAYGRLEIQRGEPRECDVTFSGSPTEIAAVIHGGAPLEMIKVEGDMALARRFVTLFPLPAKVGEC
jgi:hypothetical protein